MALTEVERRLLEGFEWQLNVTHLGQHPGPVRDCTYKTCRYALAVIDWCHQRATLSTQDVTDEGTT